MGEDSKDIVAEDQLDLPLSVPPPEPVRVRLPVERMAVTHKFTIPAGDVRWNEVNVDGRILYEKELVDLDGYVTVGVYPDGRPGEVFLKVGKAGDVWKVYDALMVVLSVALQYGVPLGPILKKLVDLKFEPRGPTTSREIPMAKSLPDYLARWMGLRFLGTREDQDDEPSERSKESKEGEKSGDRAETV